MMVGEKKWYVLRVISGKERKIKERLELFLERGGLTDVVTNILVPTEKVYKIRKGKKVIKERNLFPGYMYIEAQEDAFTGEIVRDIASQPNIIHFLGGMNPEPIRHSEVQKLLGKVDDIDEADQMLDEPFIVGEPVKIIDGPFNDFTGNIEEVYDEKKKLKVIVKIFGRRTPVEVNFMQVEKLS